MMKHQLIFNSYEELEHHLQNCIHWHTTENVGQYDTVGITTLLSALLNNLQANTGTHEYQDLKQILTKENINFLKALI